MADDDRSFLSRWSQRKVQARTAVPPAEPAPALTPAPPVAPSSAPVAAPPAASQADAPPPVTMNDVAELTHASDYSRFVAPGVDSGVSNAAMKKLFSDPHFNVMDGLDIYIGDYSQPDPIPPEMLRQMVQSKVLGLFDDEEKAEAEAVAAQLPQPADDPPNSGFVATAPGGASADNRPHDDNADLQLQPDDAAGQCGADQGTRARQV